MLIALSILALCISYTQAMVHRINTTLTTSKEYILLFDLLPTGCIEQVNLEIDGYPNHTDYKLVKNHDHVITKAYFNLDNADGKCYYLEDDKGIYRLFATNIKEEDYPITVKGIIHITHEYGELSV